MFKRNNDTATSDVILSITFYTFATYIENE